MLFRQFVGISPSLQEHLNSGYTINNPVAKDKPVTRNVHDYIDSYRTHVSHFIGDTSRCCMDVIYKTDVMEAKAQYGDSEIIFEINFLSYIKIVPTYTIRVASDIRTILKLCTVFMKCDL